MRTTRMTERIEFYSMHNGKTEDGVPIEDLPVLEFSCWAELLNTPVREYRNPTTQVGFRKESPNFAIKFEIRRPIDSSWHVKWRDKEYEITGLDPDYDRRDLTKLECKVVD
ncbi:phage head closure protein [Lactobacillus terrae]|uniref:phage head closure protein n=1 Tax=Lactobacillus terrae TaxID=2269374 RepID=UPI000C1B765A|nr:phage head closure protein [Lactobacillus terrae]